MARQKAGRRVLGPYPHRRGWRIVVVRAGGKKDRYTYPTEGKARKVAEDLKREFRELDNLTIDEALDKYEMYLREEKGNTTGAAYVTAHRARSFFLDTEEILADLTPVFCAQYYDELVKRISPRTKRPLAVDTHRATLAETKTFLKWCVGQQLLPRNPLESVQGKGKKRHGKPQLRIDEARAWLTEAVSLAEGGEPGAVAAMMALLMGLRASEIVKRTARDVDDEGMLLWIPVSKTDAGRRTVEVPEVLRPFLLKQAEGKKPEDLLFGTHWRDWPRKWVHRICQQAEVPKVTAHGMRGLHSTLAVERGVTGQIVASALGHSSPSVTFQSYVKPGSEAKARQAKVLKLLAGGQSS